MKKLIAFLLTLTCLLSGMAALMVDGEAGESLKLEPRKGWLIYVEKK